MMLVFDRKLFSPAQKIIFLLKSSPFETAQNTLSFIAPYRKAVNTSSWSNIQSKHFVSGITMSCVTYLTIGEIDSM